MSWIASKGYDAAADDALRAEAKTGGARRFWMPVSTASDEARQIVFVDDEPLRFYEHNVVTYTKDKPKGDWKNWATCPGVRDCPLCAVGHQPYLAEARTVIDREKYTAKDGRVYQDQVRLFVGKSSTITALKRESDEMRKSGQTHGLKGLVYRVLRTGDKSPAVGDNFRPEGKASSKLLAGVEALDYEALLAPNMGVLERFAAIHVGAVKYKAGA